MAAEKRKECPMCKVVYMNMTTHEVTFSQREAVAWLNDGHRVKLTRENGSGTPLYWEPFNKTEN